MKQTILLTFFILGMVFTTFAEPVTDGCWVQTASTAGEGEDIAMEIKTITPHIISLDSNNGWMGYAYYDENKDIYTGFFELLMEEIEYHPENWAGEVFQFTLSFDELTLTLKAVSPERDFKATFWAE